MVEDLSDGHGDTARRLQSKLRELFGRVTSRHSSDAEIWQQYAKLYGDGRSDNPEDNDKVSGRAANHLLLACRPAADGVVEAVAFC